MANPAPRSPGGSIAVSRAGARGSACRRRSSGRLWRSPTGSKPPDRPPRSRWEGAALAGSGCKDAGKGPGNVGRCSNTAPSSFLASCKRRGPFRGPREVSAHARAPSAGADERSEALGQPDFGRAAPAGSVAERAERLETRPQRVGRDGEGSPEIGEGSPNFGEESPDFGEAFPNFGEAFPNFGEGFPNFGEGFPNFGERSPNFGEAFPQIGEESPDFGGVPPNFGEPSPTLGGELPNLGEAFPGRSG